MKSLRAIKMEYEKVKRAVRTVDDRKSGEWYGALQALAWVLEDHAASPSRAFKVKTVPPAGREAGEG